MFDRKKPTVCMIGRWQPWHEGHTELFKKALTITGQVVIMIRESERSEDNPYSTALRELYIKQALRKEGYYLRQHYIIQHVPNITNITYGRDVGYSIEKETFDADIESISATKIRNEKSKS